MSANPLLDIGIVLVTSAVGYYLTNTAIKAAAHPNFELEQKKAMDRLNKIVEYMDRTRHKINLTSSHRLSKSEAVEFWSARESQLLELTHDFKALKAMAEEGGEICKKVLEEAELRERQWSITTALHDLEICTIM